MNFEKYVEDRNAALLTLDERGWASYDDGELTSLPD